MNPRPLEHDYADYQAPVHPRAQAKEAYVEAMFDAVAPTYDLANRLMSFGLDRGWRRRLVRESGARAGQTVLDVGCGTGDLLLDFARRVPGIRGVGLDFSAGMLERARAKDRVGLDWVQGSALELPFDDRSVDVVASAWVLRSITDPSKYFQEMARVVRPGGRILVLELTRPEHPVGRLAYAPLLNVYVPVVGRLLSGHRDGYRYLRDTIKGFWPPSRVLETMRAAGLQACGARPLTFGAATLFTAQRADGA